MKEAKTIKRVQPANDETELRRWCIEQAMRWPTETVYSNAAAQMYGQLRSDADVIGRAKKVYEWVTA